MEEKNKQEVSQEIVGQLQPCRHLMMLKLIDAINIAQDMLCAKQRTYEYTDKFDRQLARVLSDRSLIHKLLPLRKHDGELRKDISETFEIFIAYYQELYSTADGVDG